METIQTVFEQATRDVVVDAKLLARIHNFERAFVNRNEDHIAFFGSNLMGVHTMRFRPTDRDDWFLDVLEVDELQLEEDVHALKSIDPSWKRASDVMNLSCIWLLHAILKSKHLSPAQKQEGMVNVMLILQYKFLGSLMAHYYPYPANSATMMAVVDSLSKKYALKVAGSWNSLLLERAREIVTRSIHRVTFERFDNDKDIIYMVTDIQGRLREIVKSMTAVFYEMHAKGTKINTEKSVMEIDGTVVLQDKTRKYSSYIRYMHDIVSDRPSFIRDDLVAVITDAIHTMNPRLFRETLEWMSLNHRVKGAEEVEELIDESLIFAFELIASNRSLLGHNSGLMPLLAKLKSLYMASRMADPTLVKTKELAESIVAKAVRTKSSSVVASVRTGIQLYIVLRSLAMKYYQN